MVLIVIRIVSIIRNFICFRMNFIHIWGVSIIIFMN